MMDNNMFAKGGKNILVINSGDRLDCPLLNFFSELSNYDYDFYIYSDKNKADQLPGLTFRKKKIYCGPNPEKRLGLILFLILFLPLLFGNFFVLLYLKKKKEIKAVICCQTREKIIFTSLAKILNLKIIWLEFPEINYFKMPKIILRLYRSKAQSAKLINFVNLTKLHLFNLKFKEENIALIPLGIKLNQPQHQANIFSRLAKPGKFSFSQKFFTLGAIVNLSLPNQVENLLAAAKICLEVIPNLQLIVVDKSEVSAPDKHLLWLVKKLNIDNLVWFVKEQSNLRKWLDSFDIFINVNEAPKLANLEIALKAMLAGRPIIGFMNCGFEDLILDNKTGLLTKAGDSECLAQKIIELYKNKHLRGHLGKEAKNLVDQNFRLNKTIDEFEKILL